jgi:outer membrane lipoprotein carrier protein
MRLLLLLFPSLAFAAPTAPEMLTRIQKLYDNTSAIVAKFDQTLESGMGGRTRKASGQVWLKKPGRMRWDYATPEKKLMVADGSTLWVYEEEDGQAFKQPMTSSALPAQVSFLVGQGKLSDDFEATVEKVEGGQVTLKLVPKVASAGYRYLQFVVDETTGQVNETVIYDQQGGTNKLKFTDVKLNQKVEESRFKFSPPAGVKVLTVPK